MLLFITIFLVSFFHNDVCVADPLFTFCTNEYRNYTHNSLFENNLKQLLESLSSNTLLGTYDNSIGKKQDEVYGQTMCRGDVTNSTVCQNCIKNASQDILSMCMSQEAMIWYNLCQIRYSFHTFTSIMTYTGKFPNDNGEEKEVPQNPAHFAQVLEFLMKNISKEAAYDVSEKMFATGEIKYSLKNTIYGLVQCTRDISPSKCDNCLGSATADLMACCSSRESGMVLSRNCNVRFSSSRFFNNSIYSLTYPESHGPNLKTWMLVLIIICAFVLPLAILSACIVHIPRKQGNSRDEESHSILIRDLTPKGVVISTEEVLFMKLEIIKEATNYFSDTNKLGQGGFGTVYKGVLEDGSDIAVKRLSRNSCQGLEDLKNEAKLIAKLQHKNLVRLLGCVVEEEETMLLYEFMPNGSLDKLIFDSDRRSQFDWKTFYDIIIDIARGLLYLHEDSRLKIIHRDLKPSNVLLDQEMVAKISDFGMARSFCEDQKAAKTKRVVGTLGYMSPEYAMHGLFSFQSDVFAFGVILLEILSGERNSGFYQTGLDQTLLAYAWRLWSEGKELEFVEPSLMKSDGASSQAIRCMHIGLLCVQVDPQDRPDMSSIVFLLGKESMELSKPKQPPLSMRGLAALADSSTTGPKALNLGFSDISAR